jgi:hypothetical protein
MAKRKKSTKPKPILPYVMGGLFLWFMLKPKAASAGSGSYTPAITTGGNGFTPTRGSNGSSDESYLGLTPTATNRGVRNNNPGNEKRGSSAWNGKIPFAQSTDPIFEQFTDYKYGVRVIIYELKNNYIGAGHNTVDKIMRRYDPPGNTGYINHVAQRLGVGLHDTLTADKDTLKKLVQAITRWENGRVPLTYPEVVTNEQFETAWSIL